MADCVVNGKRRNSETRKKLRKAKEIAAFHLKSGDFVACVDKKDAGEKGKIQGLDESALFQ